MRNSIYENKENDINSGNVYPRKNRDYVDIYSSERRKERRKRIPILRVISFVFFLTLGIIGGIMIYGYHTLNSFNYEYVESKNVPENVNGVSENGADVDGLVNDKMVLNVLLIGSDSMSVGDGGRSDSLLIASLNIRTKKLKITSIMRDIWVDIPGYGKDRMNAAYAYGGPKLTIDTVQKNFGVLIDRFVCVDFEGFSKIVDSLGGIDMKLTPAECAYINKFSGDKHILKCSGKGPELVHLTGLQALHHSRNRNSKGSDYDRTTRQRDVIKAIIESLKNSNITKITEIVATLAPLITTNFKTSEITRLASNATSYLNFPMEEFRLPTNDNVKDEIHQQKMVLAIKNLNKAKEDLRNFIYETSESK